MTRPHYDVPNPNTVGDLPYDGHLRLPGMVNARSLEGVWTPRGPIQPGRLFRADAPGAYARMGELGAALTALGVVRIVDLRTEDEAAELPRLDGGPEVVRVGAHDPDAPSHGRRPSWADVYLDHLADNPVAMARAVRAVVEAPEGGVLVHCWAGKDRTGMLVGLLLGLVGARAEDIAADYARTGANLAAYTELLLGDVTGEERDQARADLETPAATMLGFLSGLEQRYGGVRGYARWVGLADAEVDALGQRLTA